MMYSYYQTNPKKHFFAFIFFLLALPGIAQAGLYEDGLDFSLTVASNKTQWTYNDVQRETRVDSITANFSQSISSTIRGDLRIAYLDISQSSHPESVGLSGSGNGIGIGLQNLLINDPSWQLYLRFGYDYSSTDNNRGEQRIENTWYTTTAGVDAVLAPRNSVSFVVGGGVASVDGEEQLSGPVNQVNEFEEDDSVAYYGGLSIKTDKRGRIGLRWYGGTSEGFVMNFSRSF